VSWAQAQLRTTWHCAKKPFTCATCGESGVGNHDGPMGCPKKREVDLASGTAAKFTGGEI
jgi:hypothetical protein